MTCISIRSAALLLTLVLPLVARSATPLAPGQAAPEFTLKTLDDQSVRLSGLRGSNAVVLVVLRGWPGYQCPLCTAQVRDFVPAAAELARAGARVVMVYPGPAAQLQAHAREFLADKQWPPDWRLVLDPDYVMVNAYGLRWNAPGETAYPSTFLLDRDGVIRFAKISRGHGDRVKAAEVVKQVKSLLAK